MVIRITATVVILSVVGRWLCRRSRSDLRLLLLLLLGLRLWLWLCLWLRLLVLSRWGSLRGWLHGGRGRRNRGGVCRPGRNKMRCSWLSGVITSIRNNFANLLNLLSFDIPDDLYASTLLLFRFVLGLLRCMPKCGGCFNRTNRLGRSGN